MFGLTTKQWLFVGALLFVALKFKSSIVKLPIVGPMVA